MSKGPDFSDTYVNNSKNLIFGHTRLSIRDLSKNSNQPMVSHNKDFAITYNGEIYNSKYLYEKLSKIGLKYINPKSDTEILFHNLINFGVDETLKDTKGMFAFGFWDEQRQKLFLMNRFGEKPIYYSNTDNQIYFSSDLRSLTNLFDKKLILDQFSIESLLRLISYQILTVYILKLKFSLVHLFNLIVQNIKII